MKFHIKYNYKINIFALLFVVLHAPCAMLYAANDLNAAFDDDEAAQAAAEQTLKPKSLIFKMMVVNPSDKFKQTYSMKSYLPEEVEPQHILSKEDLEIGYDAEKRAYYTTKEIELDPGVSVVKTIEIEDVWRISEAQINELATEGREIYGKLKQTKFESRARLLLSNVEVLLTQIFERQSDETVTPEEHISIFRENKKKMRDVELDLVSLRRLLANAGGDMSLFSQSAGSMPLSTTWDKESADKARGGGSIPAWVAWRVIFGILIFVGILSLGFYLTWQWQLRKAESRSKKKKTEEPINLDELFGMSKPSDDALESHVPPTGGRSGISRPIRPHFPPSVPEKEEAPSDDQAA